MVQAEFLQTFSLQLSYIGYKRVVLLLILKGLETIALNGRLYWQACTL